MSSLHTATTPPALLGVLEPGPPLLWGPCGVNAVAPGDRAAGEVPAPAARPALFIPRLLFLAGLDLAAAAMPPDSGRGVRAIWPCLTTACVSAPPAGNPAAAVMASTACGQGSVTQGGTQASLSDDHWVWGGVQVDATST
jgi:hypothetical protein